MSLSLNSLRKKDYLAGLTAGVLVAIAALAAANLWLLWRAYRQSVHDAAAERVIDAGRAIAGRLVVLAAPNRRVDTADFSRLVHVLAEAEPALFYVSVTEGGAILYQEELPPPVGPAPDVHVSRARVAGGTGDVAILTFTARTRGEDLPGRSVQVALRRDRVEREEAVAATALTQMFRMALGTVLGAFALSVGAVLWAFRRERGRERRRLAEEHLAFAGALAEGIIHDLRNPLSALGLDVQMIEREAGKGPASRPERLAELAARAHRTIGRLDAILAEFLFVSRPDDTAAERVDLHACLADCVDLMGPRFERLGVQLATDLVAGALPVLGHGTALKRALINLLVNAEQASPRGGVVTVRTSRDGDAAVMAIVDQGRGIPLADRRRVFEMFVSQRPGGFGLGLSLVKSAIESCGGTVSVADGPGGGTCFLLRFPLAPEPPVAQNPVS